MIRKIAILDPLGAHGSSHHFYLFGQSKSLTKNGYLVNLYTNKGLDLHSDDEAIYMYNGIVGAVATISLGETAVATIARNDRSKYFKIKLTDGSCYLMPEGDFQNKYKHSVSAPSGRRISLTFRHIP